MTHFILDLDDTLMHTSEWQRGNRDRASLLVDGSMEFLAACKGHITLVTCGDPKVQYQKLEVLTIDEYFERQVFAPDLLIKKRLLRHFIDYYKSSRERIVVIGDRLNCELAVGHELGCVTIRMRLPDAKRSHEVPRRGAEPNHTVSDFHELLCVLRQKHC